MSKYVALLVVATLALLAVLSSRNGVLEDAAWLLGRGRSAR
jgi:hypothetical protein